MIIPTIFLQVFYSPR